MSSTRDRRWGSALLVLAITVAIAGCRQDMHNQPKLKTYREGADRAPVEGTVARGSLKDDALTPKIVPAGTAPAAPAPAAGVAPPVVKVVDDFPFAITAEMLARGQNRFNVYCAPCHSVLGDGNGMIVQRGFRRPPSYTDPRIRNSPASHFYDVMTNGFGAMSSYNDKLSPEDRWKVAAYIRALQLSQAATIDDVPAADRPKLDASESGKTQGGQHEK